MPKPRPEPLILRLDRKNGWRMSSNYANDSQQHVKTMIPIDLPPAAHLALDADFHRENWNTEAGGLFRWGGERVLGTSFDLAVAGGGPLAASLAAEAALEEIERLDGV